MPGATTAGFGRGRPPPGRYDRYWMALKTSLTKTDVSSLRKSGISASHRARTSSTVPSWRRRARTYSARTSASASDLHFRVESQRVHLSRGEIVKCTKQRRVRVLESLDYPRLQQGCILLRKQHVRAVVQSAQEAFGRSKCDI
jgi:hypothetical protein